MTYRTILVSLNEVGRLPQVIGAAGTLGRILGAHVAGLYVIPAIQVYPSVGFEAAPQVFEGNRTYFKDNAAKVRTAFEEAMKREGLAFSAPANSASTTFFAEYVDCPGGRNRAMSTRSSPAVMNGGSTYPPLRVCGMPMFDTRALQRHFRPAVFATSPPLLT